MGHAVHIQSREQHIAALKVLDRVKGMWTGVGTSSDPVLLLSDRQFKALVKAGVIQPNGKEGKARGKKAKARKTDA
jgi:cell division GTPase FtsZ